MGVFGAFFGSKNVFSVFGFKMAQLAKKMEKIEKKIFLGPKIAKKKISGPRKKKKFFFDFFFSIREKKQKKFFFDFFPIEGHPSGGDRIFGQKHQKKFFFDPLTFLCQFEQNEQVQQT